MEGQVGSEQRGKLEAIAAEVQTVSSSMTDNGIFSVFLVLLSQFLFLSLLLASFYFLAQAVLFESQKLLSLDYVSLLLLF